MLQITSNEVGVIMTIALLEGLTSLYPYLRSKEISCLQLTFTKDVDTDIPSVANPYGMSPCKFGENLSTPGALLRIRRYATNQAYLLASRS